MLFRVKHKTTYDYGDTVPECFNIVRLHPRPIFDQVCLSHELVVEPKPVSIVQRHDFFGNRIEQFSIEKPHGKLEVFADNQIEVTGRNYPEFDKTPPWEDVANMESSSNLEVAHFAHNSARVRSGVEAELYARKSFLPGRPIAEATLELTQRIFEDFDFDSHATTVSTPVEEVFRKKAGVCQDFAHLQLACLRSLNLPARYISGYLRTIPPPGQSRLVGADASHAWISVYCGDYGWFDFDPTNNLVPQTDHITIGWGRDYSDICPIQGVFTGGGQTTMTVSVDVIPE
ncbi:MAG: transglutaminase family protein [Planctomycetota bacterium]